MATLRRVGIVTGVIQGVGFRPFVARLAREGSLGGSVRNEGAYVRIEVEGDAGSVERFVERLGTELPEPARIDSVRWNGAPPRGGAIFVIEKSEARSAVALPIPPDLATCAACLAEVRDPTQRRHGYPFTNCTACGPRFTIVEGLPYDRPMTTMGAFELCEPCEREYRDPTDRRYHAQPIACPACGPALRLTSDRGAPIATGDEALERAVAALRVGHIVAVKGLGGFQLLCDATSPSAVARLRLRKRRPHKPLAVMVASVQDARQLAFVSGAEADALKSPAAPIVLMRKRGDAPLAANVAPRVAKIGLLLPTTPLHHLFAARASVPFVCTSGNLHEEPIAIDDDDARARLGSIADVFLTHDRRVARRADDGVVHVVGGVARTLRLARGLGPIALPIGGDPTARLCVGAHLKNAPALAIHGSAILWPHVGDLNSVRAREAFEEAVADLQSFLGASPLEVVCDRHPDYASSLFAARTGLPVRAVHHHHAHIAACLAEHAQESALGFAWDGLGLGADGGLWGGEVLRVDRAGARRVASLSPFPLPGGDAAARDGRRALAGVLVAADRAAIADEATRSYVALAHSAHLAPPTSSVGRLFDAVAAATGVCVSSTFEGQAAMELESIAEPGAAPYPFRIGGGQVDWRPMIDPLLAERDDAVRVASRFHATLVSWIVELAVAHAPARVALAGGCFQNARLAEDALGELSARGFEAWLPTQVPCNDGGIALGQAWVASRASRTAAVLRPSRRDIG